MQWIKIQYRTNYYFRKSLTSFCMYKTELLRAETIVGCRTVVCVLLVKVSKFQNKFLKSSFLPKYEPICAKQQGRTSYNNWFVFWEKKMTLSINSEIY